MSQGLLEEVILRGLAAARPLATDVAAGTLYYSTDTATTDRSNGTSWETYADTGAAGAINQLTGDVTAGPGAGSQVATIANNAVSDAKLRDSVALSVIGRSVNSGGDPADISATPASDAVLRESGSVIGFGTVATAGIANDAITFAKIQNINTDRLLGRDTAASGDVEEIPVSSGLEFTGGPGLRVTQAVRTEQIGITVDGGGSALTTGVKGYKSFPVAGTIIGVRLLADQVGSIVMDIWKDTFANYPPTVADTITASAKPTISSNDASEDTTLTGWTTSVSAGDVFGFNIDSITTITRITLELTIAVTG